MAENRHQAILQGDYTCGDVGGPAELDGLMIHQRYWIVDGFVIQGHCIPAFTDAANTEIRHTIIRDWGR
jgi:hypothetical protein